MSLFLTFLLITRDFITQFCKIMQIFIVVFSPAGSKHTKLFTSRNKSEKQIISGKSPIKLKNIENFTHTKENMLWWKTRLFEVFIY